MRVDPGKEEMATLCLLEKDTVLMMRQGMF